VELRRIESQCYAFSGWKAENASSIGILPLNDFPSLQILENQSGNAPDLLNAILRGNQANKP